uniref:Ig-like domain-containing protein n=1 Tax=Amphilophus citrinellus TaxID=61819 RepID=A0A3Q0SQK5_AMPCI
MSESLKAVSEGAAVSLPCYVSTTGSACWSLRWEKNGTVVFERSFNESRVSVPSDWYQRADLSLTLKRPEVKDQGVYYCDIDKAEKHRSAVRLIVRVIVPKSMFKGSTRGAGGETSQREEGMKLRGVSNGGGLLSNSQEDVEGEDVEDRGSERDQQQMFMSNGFH